MGIFSIFSRKKEPENYETVLEELRLSIQSRQSRLAEIRLRERRASLWVTLYLCVAWGLYTTVWYTGWLERLVGNSDEFGTPVLLRKILFAIPTFIGPILIIFTRRIVQLWYTRIGNAEEATLKKLMLEQRTKVEELKKKTDFYSTQKLLERYDRPETQSLATPAKRPVGPRPSAGVPPMQPILGANNTTPVRPLAPGMNGATPMPPGYLGLTPQPIAPTPRRWYDRVADAVLGEDEAGSGSAHSKYALICKRCFTHNGLVRESDFDDTQFVCMKCGFLNPAPKPTKAANTRSLINGHSPEVQGNTLQASPPSPSPSNPPNVAPMSMINSDTDETPSKRPTQKLTQRRQTRNSRKSMKDADGHDMELDS